MALLTTDVNSSNCLLNSVPVTWSNPRPMACRAAPMDSRIRPPAVDPEPSGILSCRSRSPGCCSDVIATLRVPMLLLNCCWGPYRSGADHIKRQAVEAARASATWCLLRRNRSFDQTVKLRSTCQWVRSGKSRADPNMLGASHAGNGADLVLSEQRVVTNLSCCWRWTRGCQGLYRISVRVHSVNAPWACKHKTPLVWRLDGKRGVRR